MTQEGKLRFPETWERVSEAFCSNFDHYINTEVAERMVKEDIVAEYPGWNFFGMVWYDKELEKYCCHVMQYHSHVDTLFADTPEELKESVCEKYGSD